MTVTRPHGQPVREEPLEEAERGVYGRRRRAALGPASLPPRSAAIPVVVLHLAL